MNPYRVCPNCGAHLDPGETCDCATDVSCENIATKLRAALEKSLGRPITLEEFPTLLPSLLDRFLKQDAATDSSRNDVKENESRSPQHLRSLYPGGPAPVNGGISL